MKLWSISLLKSPAILSSMSDLAEKLKLKWIKFKGSEKHE
jgi:hypothetical protein